MPEVNAEAGVQTDPMASAAEENPPPAESSPPESPEDPEEAPGAEEATGKGPDAERSESTPWVNPVVETLRRELASRDEQLRSYITAYKEAVADMERERERMAREREQLADKERMALAGQLLEVLDNLDRSLSSAGTAEPVTDLLVGLGMVRKQFVALLDSLGAERIPTVGHTFDAALHEATGMIPASGSQKDQEVVFEELPGYLFKGKLLRAARVVVASASS